MPDNAAILLTSLDHGRQIVAHCCPRSAAKGVHPGMTLTHARALIGNQPVVDQEHQPRRDAAALRALAHWAIRFTPLVAPDPPDGLLLDVSGCDRLYGGERRLLNVIGNTIERLGFAVRAACAGTIGCAWAVARFGSHDRAVIDPGAERAAAEPLPIHSLRIDDRTIAALREVNIDRMGDVLALPRLEIAVRFDDLLLRRIDQLLGDAAEVIEPIRPREPIRAERIFDGAVSDVEAMGIVSRELIEQAAAELTRQESGAMRMELELIRLDATPIRIPLRFSHPTRDVHHLWSLLRPRVEAVHMGFGIEQMTLTVTSSQRMAHAQQAAWSGASSASNAPQDQAAGQLIDLLTDRLGAARTLGITTTQSHRPERVAVHQPAMNGSASLRSPAAVVVDEDRPSVLLDQPEAVEVMAVIPEGPPIWIRWRGMDHRILAAHGPQRIDDEWWIAQRHRQTTQLPDGRRDYFKVQVETGRWLWIFRAAETGRWHLHGEWA